MPKIKIYSTRTCPYCHMLKQYLTSKNINYEEVFIDNDIEEARRSLDACGSMGVPCTHIELDDGKQINILGFNKPKFDEVLGL